MKRNEAKPKATRDKIMEGIAKAINGQPIDDVGPVLVVAVARVIVIDADGDQRQVARNLSKFMLHLADTINDMLLGDPEPKPEPEEIIH